MLNNFFITINSCEKKEKSILEKYFTIDKKFFIKYLKTKNKIKRVLKNNTSDKEGQSAFFNFTKHNKGFFLN